MPDETRWSRARLTALWDGWGDENATTPRGKKRARLLRAATELFTEQGYRKTSVDEIARRAGVAKGTVYTFFPTKAALMIEAVAIEKKALIQMVEPILSGALPPEQRLRFDVRTVLSAMRELPLTTRLVFDHEDFVEILDELGPEDAEERRQQGVGMITELIELAVPGQLTDEVKRARAGVLHGLNMVWPHLLDAHVRGPFTFEEFTRQLEDFLVAGLVAPTNGEGP